MYQLPGSKATEAEIFFAWKRQEKNCCNNRYKIYRKCDRIPYIYYIEKGGGGPENNHTHSDNHIFIVVDGEVRVVLGDEETVVGKNESIFVDGMIPHSIWNNGEKTAVVIKICTARKNRS